MRRKNPNHQREGSIKSAHGSAEGHPVTYSGDIMSSDLQGSAQVDVHLPSLTLEMQTLVAGWVLAQDLLAMRSSADQFSSTR